MSLRAIFKNHLGSWEPENLSLLMLLLFLHLSTLDDFQILHSPVKTGGASELEIQSCISAAEVFNNQSSAGHCRKIPKDLV